MALEINEIGIRMRIGPESDDKQIENESDESEARDSERQRIVEDCVRRVLQILRATRDR